MDRHGCFGNIDEVVAAVVVATVVAVVGKSRKLAPIVCRRKYHEYVCTCLYIRERERKKERVDPP